MVSKYKIDKTDVVIFIITLPSLLANILLFLPGATKISPGGIILALWFILTFLSPFVGVASFTSGVISIVQKKHQLDGNKLFAICNIIIGFILVFSFIYIFTHIIRPGITIL